MAAGSGLPFGPLTGRSIHLCIDMQGLFAEPTPWHTPWAAPVLPLIEEIVRHHAERTVFTRFLPPSRPEEMPGSWQRYYRRWREMTLERIDPELLELVPTLARADAIVITGAETDVCVLAAVLGAVDFGYRVVIASDAICSSADATHDALLKLYESRFSEQIEIAETELILASWRTE